jgi:hypothetical protein
MKVFHRARLAIFLALLTTPVWGGTVLYSDGAINGTEGGSTIFNFLGNLWSVSDSFTLASNSTVTDLSNIGIWLDPGDTLTSLDWIISTAADGGGTVEGSADNAPSTSTQLTPAGSYGNDGNYNVYNVSFSVTPGLSLAAGTYYLTLEEGITNPTGTAVYWDVNYGPSSTTYYFNGAFSGSLRVGPVRDRRHRQHHQHRPRACEPASARQRTNHTGRVEKGDQCGWGSNSQPARRDVTCLACRPASLSR